MLKKFFLQAVIPANFWQLSCFGINGGQWAFDSDRAATRLRRRSSVADSIVAFSADHIQIFRPFGLKINN
jgi:hypothetical protein